MDDNLFLISILWVEITRQINRDIAYRVIVFTTCSCEWLHVTISMIFGYVYLHLYSLLVHLEGDYDPIRLTFFSLTVREPYVPWFLLLCTRRPGILYNESCFLQHSDPKNPTTFTMSSKYSQHALPSPSLSPPPTTTSGNEGRGQLFPLFQALFQYTSQPAILNITAVYCCGVMEWDAVESGNEQLQTILEENIWLILRICNSKIV